MMKPKLLEIKFRRHPLAAAGSVEMPAAPAGYGLSSARAWAGPDLTSWSPARRNQKSLLLVSNDAGLGVRVSNTADLAGLAFQHIHDTANALRRAAQDRPTLVLLDLDLAAAAGWRAAEEFLQDENGPSLALMTGRIRHCDLGMAIGAGMVLDKSIAPRQLLAQLRARLARSDRERERQRACQRLLVRWLRPYETTAPTAPDCRHWGINE
jgi:CheY-like chemotaxis protein